MSQRVKGAEFYYFPIFNWCSRSGAPHVLEIRPPVEKILKPPLVKTEKRFLFIRHSLIFSRNMFTRDLGGLRSRSLERGAIWDHSRLQFKQAGNGISRHRFVVFFDIAKTENRFWFIRLIQRSKTLEKNLNAEEFKEETLLSHLVS